MDRTILIFVKDKRGADINGADIQFFRDEVPVGTAVSVRGRASIQVEDGTSLITIKVTYDNEVQSAKLAQAQNSYTFEYDVEPEELEYEEKPGESFFTKYLPVVVGILLLGAGTTLAFVGKSPFTGIQKQAVLILLSLGAGGVASAIPGFLNVRLTLGQKLVVSAAGALAVFIIVFFFPPAFLE